MRLDNPTENDKLGFTPYVIGIEKLIKDTSVRDLPITIGIYGAWGSGKSSFMMQLRKRLVGGSKHSRGKIPTIWFEAWKYDRTQDVRSALIYQILNGIYASANEDTKTKILNATKKWAQISLSLVKQMKLSPTIVGTGGISFPTLKEIQDDVADWKRFQTAVDKFSFEFDAAVKAYLKEYGSKRLVIFIDDLDRCLPENVIIILEALKLFLTVSSCVFVIGIDRSVAEKAIQIHYGIKPGIDREYLDKIIHYSFNVPPISSDQLKQLFTQLIPYEMQVEDCLYVISQAAQGNPRLYLRLSSSFALLTELAKTVTPSLFHIFKPNPILALSTAISVRFPEFHNFCKNNPSGFYTYLEAISHTTSPTKEEYLIQRNAPEFVQYLNNEQIRQFLFGVFPEFEDVVKFFGGNDTDFQNTLREAFSLAQTII